jgi:DNA-binding MarR family transcriptional regulator
MLLLRDLPKYEAIRQRAGRYPQIDPRAVESSLVLLRVASDVIDAIEAYLALHGMSQGKFTILMLLNRDPASGMSPSELAEKSGVTRATITGLLDGLEREQLVIREGHAEDRRKAVVRLTPRAVQLLDGILPEYYRQIAEMMGGLLEEQKVQLITLLGKVSERVPAVSEANRRSPARARESQAAAG